jgi:cytoskeleton protein RodZ
VSKFSTTQQQQLAEIGAYLQQVRLEQNKSLDEIATRTFIPMRLLKAIEQGQSGTLPEAVFVRGFIRRFGEALNLDGTAIALEFTLDDTEPLPQPITPQPITPQLITPQPVPAHTAELEPEPVDERYARRERRPRNDAFPWSTALVFGLIALIGALFAYGLSRRATQPELAASPSVESPSVAPLPSSPNASVTAPSSPAETVAPSTPLAAASPSPTVGATPVSVSLNLTDRSWLRVTVDGKVEFEGILAEGAQQSWAAQQAIVIRAGNAGAVVVSPNQGTAQPMGNPGTVATQTFTPSGLQSQ